MEVRMPHYRITVLCPLLAVLFGVSMLSAQTGGAMLYANGNVKVNGQAAGDSTSIFSGDKVDVTESSSVSINRSGSSVVVSPNSSIQYDPASVEVIQGSARVSTSKGMSASAGQILVSPKDTVAKFDVLRTCDKVVVVSREGALTVKDGSHTTVVQSGASTELALNPATGQGLSGDQGSKAVPATFISDRLVEHPFYGVVKGVDDTPSRLHVCADVLECIRSHVSQIRPCCCPPRIPCQ
jgi:ethanolamine utilization protein EutQ (cupin superfamily)